MDIELFRTLPDRGFKLFPLVENGKIPAQKRWPQSATADWEKLDWLLRGDRNAGIFTGRYRHNQSLVVIDVDVKHGQRGIESLLELEMMYDEFPQTYTVRTPTGGKHIYLWTREKIASGVDVLGPGLDIRSQGGYVVAPGSATSDGEYTVIDGAPVAEAPEWLLKQLPRRGARKTSQEAALVELDHPACVARVRELLLQAEPAIEGRHGDDRTFATACEVKDQGVTEYTASVLMEEVYNPRCIPPWEPEALATKVSSAYRNGQNPPGNKSVTRGLDKWTEQPAPANNPEPMDILAGASTVLPDLPEHAVPPLIYRFARDKAERLGVETGMIALPALVIAASCISDDYKIQPKIHDTEWTESARLWLGLVGDPASKKSPALKAPLTALRKIEAIQVKEDEKKLAEYNFQLKAYDAREKACIRQAAETGGAVSQPPNQPVKPPSRRKLVEDVTIEKLSDVLHDNATGVLAFRDELSGWLASMDQYKQTSGSDRTNWLELYNGGQRVIDRVGRGSWTVDNWSACVLGGIQPDRLRSIKKTLELDSDGLLQRFLFIINTRTDIREIDRAPDAKAEAGWADLLNNLSQLPIMFDPENIILSQEAQLERARVDRIIDAWLVLPDQDNAFRGALGKLKATYARLVLTMHAIENAEEAVLFSQPLPGVVSGVTAKEAADLLLDYLLPHLSSFYATIIGAQASTEQMQWIAGHILAHQEKTKISLRELKRAYHALRAIPDEDITRIMDRLDLADWVRPIINENGRPVKAWTINPLVRVRFADKAREESERRDAACKQIKAATANLARGRKV